MATERKRALLRLFLAMSAVLLIALCSAWWARGPLAVGMMVMAPSPRGVPAAAPADVRTKLVVERNGASVRAWAFDPPGKPRGTVLLLHGIRDNKLSLVTGARGHAARGFRAVAVDSRGHGESSGRYLTYGVEESRDLVALVDQLERRGLLVPPLAVVGSSYGAATALQYAALDARVEKVVALAPFASLRRVVRAYLDWRLGWPARLVSPSSVNALIDDCARQAGFDPDRACPLCVAPRIRAAVLLIHSRGDERIPWRHSAAIHAALRSRKQLMLVEGVGHVDTGGGAGVVQATERWLDAQ